MATSCIEVSVRLPADPRPPGIVVHPRFTHAQVAFHPGHATDTLAAVARRLRTRGGGR